MFKVEDDKNNTISFDLYPNATISWINDKAPVDAPECGFENEKCPVEVKKKLCKLQLLCREVKRIDGFTINKIVYFYHINYGVIQGFPALRKAVTTHLKKYGIFSRVFDIANQLLTPHPRHSVKLMNERQSLHHSQSKVVCQNFFRLWLLKKINNPYRLITDSDVQTFPRSRRKPKYEKKNRKTLVMVFLATENENRKLELDLPQADVDVYVKDFFGREGMSQ